VTFDGARGAIYVRQDTPVAESLAPIHETIWDHAMSLRNQYIFGLLLFAVVDAIIPIPFAEIILLYVLIKKPLWFREMVDRVYSGI
jgi:hypothetical protein